MNLAAAGSPKQNHHDIATVLSNFEGGLPFQWATILALQLSFQQGLSRQNASMRKSAVVFAVLHTLPLGSHPREKESADVADAGCQFISRASFQESLFDSMFGTVIAGYKLKYVQRHTCKINRVYTGCILHDLFFSVIFYSSLFISNLSDEASFIAMVGWEVTKVLTCMAMDIVEILQLSEA